MSRAPGMGDDVPSYDHGYDDGYADGHQAGYLAALATIAPPAVPQTVPLPAAFQPSGSSYTDHVAVALQRLPEQFRGDA